MAPEQLEAAAVDTRTDIFAFGGLLYEMITGARAFSGNLTARAQLHVARFPDGAFRTQLTSEYVWVGRWINDGEMLLLTPRGMRILPLTREGNAWIAGTPRDAARTVPTGYGRRQTLLDLLQDPSAESQSVTLMTGWM